MGYFGNWNKDQRVFQKAFTYNGCTKNNMQILPSLFHKLWDKTK